MPVTVPIPHHIYSHRLAQDALDLSACRCPQCLSRTERGLPTILLLTKSRVRRQVWTLERDAEGFRRGPHRAGARHRALSAVWQAVAGLAV